MIAHQPRVKTIRKAIRVIGLVISFLIFGPQYPLGGMASIPS
jgi:hypothetical protein